MDTYQALYYPFIHFKDDAWVKLAALYWDKLGRIVPGGYTTDDSETVKALGRFVTTLRPESASYEVGASFVAFITEYGSKLQATYGLSRRDAWPGLSSAERPPKAGGSSGEDPRLGYIYHEKMSHDLYRALNECDLASTDDRGQHWIGMHPRLAWVYMTALAEELSAKHGLRPLTDETRDHLALSGLSTERLAHALLNDVALVDAKPTATEIETTLVSVAFRAVVPTDLAALSVDKILDFRDKYPKERATFQEAVAGLLKDREWLASISDRHVLEERLHDEYDKVWTVRLEELREKLKEVGIDTMFSCFNLKATLPAGAAAGAAALGAPLNLIAAGTAVVAFGAIPLFRAKRKAAQELLHASDVSYLYRMQQDLKPMDLWSKIKQRSLEFALGT